jgi:A/G-specific adenine glycosylase
MPHPDTGLTSALLDHFDAHRRAMPWRETSDPYAIWVSEVMLQQTRVDTVVPYFRRWLEKFPDVDALAGAPLDDVLKAWEGLGYYSRARTLHRAAGVVRERYGGRVPSDPDELRELPGVGEYTAGAVASIAFGVRTPAVDGNVRRVRSRLHDLEDPRPSRIRELAAELVPAERAGDFNQALMELGATVCTPRSPSCDTCPVAAWCRARERGTQELRPRPRSAGRIPVEAVRTAVVVRGDDALLLVRRPAVGLLAGLWEFPGDPGAAAEDPRVVTILRRSTPGPALEPVVHAFSHKRVTYRPTLWRDPGDGGSLDTAGDASEDATLAASDDASLDASGDAKKEVNGEGDGAGDLAWVRPAALDAYALPVAQRTIQLRAMAHLRNGRGARG